MTANIFICNDKTHECDGNGKLIIVLRDGREVEQTEENLEKYQSEICGSSVSCSICGMSAISKAMWL